MPRAGLSSDAVIALGLQVVDDGGPNGFSDLTLSAVASLAGVAVPSLYKHVKGLAGLRRGVARHCVDGLTDAVAGAATGHTGSAALWAMAAATRDYAMRYPGRYAAAQGPSWANDPDAAEVNEAGARTVAVIAAGVQAIGVPAERTVDAVRAFRSLVHGFVVLELEGGFGMPDDVEASFRYAVESLGVGLAPAPRSGTRPSGS